MSEKFFKRLSEKATCNLPITLDHDVSVERGRGMQAIIEALKEMMVGGPIKGSLRHVLNPPDAPHTMLDNSAVKDPAYGEALFERHIGTDGEEVVVLCLKLQ